MFGAQIEEPAGDGVGPPVDIPPGDPSLAVHDGDVVGTLLGHDLPHVGEVPSAHGGRTYAADVDFELPGDDDARRLEVRAWLAEHPRPSGRELAESGYVAPHWPPPWGLSA